MINEIYAVLRLFFSNYPKYKSFSCYPGTVRLFIFTFTIIMYIIFIILHYRHIFNINPEKATEKTPMKICNIPHDYTIKFREKSVSYPILFLYPLKNHPFRKLMILFYFFPGKLSGFQAFPSATYYSDIPISDLKTKTPLIPKSCGFIATIETARTSWITTACLLVRSLPVKANTVCLFFICCLYSCCFPTAIFKDNSNSF